MDWKKLGKALLFPHIAIMIVLVPISIVLLVASMVFIGTESAIAYISYVLSAYTLTVWCVRAPYLIRRFKTFRNENKYARRWLEDVRFRVNLSLVASLLGNVAYAALQLGLGYYHRTFWFGFIGAYYICLAVIRFFLLCHTRKYAPGERREAEARKYRASGRILLVMNLSLAMILVFMLYWNRTFHHHMITAIAMAAYTFSSFTVAVVSIVRYRKYNSPVLSAAKAVSFASACVSMLTLTSTMLTAFGQDTMDVLSQKVMLGCVGGAVLLIVIAMAVYMIVGGNKKMKAEVQHGEHS